jgi:CubicO group peptidase (beta-lactamase class C family)
MRWVLVLLLFLTGGPAKAASLDDAVRTEMNKRHIPGLSLAVLKEGKVLAIKNYGMANLETRVPATAQTVYKIASLSKAFIADAILLLAQEGRLGLDDRATKYLTDAPQSWRGITVRQLLNHVSGIVRDPPDYHPYDEQPVMDVIKSSYALPLASAPGEKYLYSNIGYYVLAEIISRVSGQSWDDYIAAHFFAPAGMTATRTTTQEIVPNRANGYYWRNNRYLNAEDWIAVRPSGAFLSTLQDMVRWDQFQRSAQFPLNAQSRAEAESPPHLADGSRSGYGFGWTVDKFLGQTRIHHDGTYPGFRSDYEKFSSGLSVILLTNSENGSVEGLALKIAGYFDSSLKAPRFSVSASAPSPAQSGKAVAIAVSATDLDRAAPDSLVELEIWDANGKAVFKQHRANEDFQSGQSRDYLFSWLPASAGTYTVNVGAYGPHWVTSYGWAEKAAVIKVN